jgi:hypothetical protein
VDDRQRSQGLKALKKIRTAAEDAASELEDILENGCGATKQVKASLGRVEKIHALAKEAHGFISTAHIEAANAEKGEPLPFAEGEEATRAPRARDRKKAAAGDDEGGEGGE